jgi:hypothetical protein
MPGLDVTDRQREVEQAPDLSIVLGGWTGGLMPEPVRREVLNAQRRRALRQDDIARRWKLSRPQVPNVMQARSGLSSGAVRRIKSWLSTGAACEAIALRPRERAHQGARSSSPGLR